MNPDLAGHPLVSRFWKREGKKMTKTDSMTEDDFEYTIRLDEEAVELAEDQVSYYDSSARRKGTFRGRWEALRVTPWKVVLKLTGADGAEKALVLTDDDIVYTDLAWVISRHMGQPVVVEASEAAAHGLPPVRVAVDIQGLGFMPYVAPGNGTYFSLSGPPGGPLFFSVHALRPSLDAWLRDVHAKDPHFELGAAETLDFRGKPCPAQLYFTGSQHAASSACALALPDAGIAFVFGHGMRTAKSCGTIAAFRPLAEVLKRIEIG